jgi:hypothetical protein
MASPVIAATFPRRDHSNAEAIGTHEFLVLKVRPDESLRQPQRLPPKAA